MQCDMRRQRFAHQQRWKSQRMLDAPGQDHADRKYDHGRELHPVLSPCQLPE
jgi:hypothetical protein